MIKFFEGFHLKLIDYIAYSIKEILTNPQRFIMRKFARFNAIRKLKNLLVQKNIYTQVSKNKATSIFTQINIDNVVEELKQDGLFQGLQLPDWIIQEILEFSFNANCYAAKKPKLGFLLHEKEKAEIRYKTKILVAKYFNTASLCPAIKMLENDTVLLEIAAKYLNAQPVHISNSLFWSFPTNSTFFEQSKAAQVYHCDLDDYKFLKFFFYLTDVDLNSGPHAYILGSHRKKKFLQQLLRGRSTEEDLIKYYGIENFITICGKAGWGFAEDTFGYHKGSPPIDKPRLILQVFATYDYGTQQDIINANQLKSIS